MKKYNRKKTILFAGITILIFVVAVFIPKAVTAAIRRRYSTPSF